MFETGGNVGAPDLDGETVHRRNWNGVARRPYRWSRSADGDRLLQEMSFE